LCPTEGRGAIPLLSLAGLNIENALVQPAEKHPMGRELLLYALHDDALAVLQSVESHGPLQYVLTGAFDSTATPVYETALSLPGLGTTQIADRTGSDRYMVFRPAVQVVRRKVPQNDGGVLYFVDPWRNAPCILFQCGGLFEDQGRPCVITGEIATGYAKGPALNLFRRFERQVKKQFTRIETPWRAVYYVGPSAMKLLRKGIRFTDSLGGTTDVEVMYQQVGRSVRQK
jgi:hypothetical protein